MIQFADGSGLEIPLIYDPPYHSKYNPIERCWSALQQKWNGVLLTCREVVQACAQRMKWRTASTLPSCRWTATIRAIVPSRKVIPLLPLD